MSAVAPIYLDYNATTPLAPEARAAMVAALEVWGNPSSVHAQGRRARQAVESARRDVAGLLGGLPEEVVFTSGGTEANHLAVRGLARAASRARGLEGQRPHVVSSRLEHPSVHGALETLEAEGFAVTFVPVPETGQLSAAALTEAMRDDTVLVTLAVVNHEIGNRAPLEALAQVAHARGALFHSDGVQAVGRIPLDVGALGVDAMTVSAHKLHGPKGVGAVWLRRGVRMDPLLAGGHQERGRRAGTENVPGIVGFGAAAGLAPGRIADDAGRVAGLRDRLESQLLAIPGARLHGDQAARVPGTTNVGFAGAAGQLVAIGLDLEGICVSTGAACSSGTLAPSPVLLALGLGAREALEGVRFSLGRDIAREQVDRAAAVCATVVARVRRARQ